MYNLLVGHGLQSPFGECGVATLFYQTAAALSAFFVAAI